jgi:hypothetical protein
VLDICLKQTPEQQKRFQEVSDSLLNLAVVQINCSKIQLQQEFPELEKPEGQDYINLNVPYDCIVRLMSSMMQGRSMQERQVLSEMFSSDLSEMVAEPGKDFRLKYAPQLQKSHAGVMAEVMEAFENNPQWTEDEKYLFITALFASVASNLLEDFTDHSVVQLGDFEKFLNVLQDCLIDCLTAAGEIHGSPQENEKCCRVPELQNTDG